MSKIAKYITKKLSRESIMHLIKELLDWVEDYDMHQDMEDSGVIVRIDDETSEVQ